MPEGLIQRAKDGDHQAFNQIVLAYRKRVRGTVDRITASPEHTADISETVFLRLHFSLHQLNPAQSFEPWLYRLRSMLRTTFCETSGATDKEFGQNRTLGWRAVLSDLLPLASQTPDPTIMHAMHRTFAEE